MAVFNLPILGNSFLLPTVLTSLIVGFVFLILSERKKKGESGGNDGVDATLKSTVKLDSNALRSVSNDADEKKEEDGENVKGESTTCSSGSEEEEGEKKRTTKKKKKHSCEGAKACSSKKTVSDVLVLAEDNEQSKTCVEEFTSRLATGGLNCSTSQLVDDAHPSLSFLEGGPTLLNLFVLTSLERCEELLSTLLDHAREDNEEKANFIYSVVCLTDSNDDLLMETAERLSAELTEKGGAEWIPLTCISSSKEPADPKMLSPQKYTTKVLNKVKKISKKCCGTSCGTKKSVDIEDLAASLLPAITPVKT